MSYTSSNHNDQKDSNIVYNQYDNSDLIECSYCSRIWDGNAQCPCTLYSDDSDDSDDSDESIERI